MRQLKISKSITNRESRSIEVYLQEIGKITALTEEEEAEMARRKKQGDQQALNRLIEANLKFVISVAKQYQGRGLSLGDLISEGNYGLIKAAQRFDETKGFKFISYAVWWIRQQILQALAEQGQIVRLPLNVVSTFNKCSKAYRTFEQENSRSPSGDELAYNFQISKKEVNAFYRVINSKAISLDAPMEEGDDDGQCFLDTLDVNNNSGSFFGEQNDLSDILSQIFPSLTQRQKEIICFYFGIGVDQPMSLEDIGHRYDLTRERIRQIKDKILEKLGKGTRAKLLAVYRKDFDLTKKSA
jgi:RNA polymerase primary sigma factor